ncbi:hypothetical protein FC72_GL001989 [Companilactobacillus tucceti DSM 20183]|uniref:SAM-dependent methyltransferase n=1 Tax=Companilactobacillus tucceti DSM 20183 TaxID=1423811 RepID=A0A0R1J0Z3_9LACO|nr:hypothetical protein [Companilactobacillus tucceti]KRK64747.1 hypothetical protein FC72_GL001989 [Companilactobacillus tucceti DSM 20183]
MSSSYISGLRDDVGDLPNGRRFKARIDFMDHVCQALSNKELPKHRFPYFQLSEKELASYLNSLTDLDQAQFEEVVSKLQKFDHDLREFRTYLQVRFGYWATITSDLMKTWSDLYPDKKYLELMAGNGYISRGFKDNGISSICTDDLSWAKQSQTGLSTLVNVENLDALAALKKYSRSVDAVILAWSPDREEIDYDILQLVREADLELFVIGEKNGATNSHKFWENAEVINNDKIEMLNKVYKQYDLVKDKIYLIK